MSVFGTWYCHTCEKEINVGTVAPRSVMSRHRVTKNHLAIFQAKQNLENAEKLDIDVPDREQRIQVLKDAVRNLMRKRRF